MTDLSPRDVLDRLTRFTVERGPAGFADMMAVDAVLELPFLAPGVARRIEGREAIRAFLAAAPHAAQLRFLEHRVVGLHETRDPQVIVAELELRGTSVGSEQPFSLSSVTVLRVRDGEVVHCRDYFDPTAVAHAAGAAPRQVVEALRCAILDKDLNAFAELFAEDGVLEYVFSVPGKPTRLEGREAIRAYMAASPAPALLDIHEVHTTVHETRDPEIVVAEIDHSGMSRATLQPYRLAAIGVIRVQNGKITAYRDYMDVRPLAALSS